LPIAQPFFARALVVWIDQMRELSELTFFESFRRRYNGQLRYRPAVLCDDNFFALRGVLDELRKVGLGFVEIDLARHDRTLVELVKLVKAVGQA